GHRLSRDRRAHSQVDDGARPPRAAGESQHPFNLCRRPMSMTIGEHMTRRLLTGLGLVAAFFLGWSVRGDRDVASAQAARKPIMMTRIYTGTDGLSLSGG